MLSGKYHIGSLVAVFLALGIGILIGGTMGQNWVDKTEARLVEQVLDKYERSIQENKHLHKQLTSLQMMNRSVAPFLEQKQIWWIKPDDQPYDMLAMAASSLGAVWEEKLSDEIFNAVEANNSGTMPDILVLSDSDAVERWRIHEQERQHLLAKTPVVIDASHRTQAWNDPKEIVQFILYLKQIVEEEQHASKASVDIYHYSGME
jgi:hypothetical protein